MNNISLAQSRAYEIEKAKEIKDIDRPLFHLTPYVGWMNDPNGFSYYKGQYHMFYQYYPFDKVWGPMHWGHAVSDDLIKWTYLPAAIAPDSSIDSFGCFSGSAIETKDGKHLLLYTGVYEDSEDKKRCYQTQCIAIGDGLDYEFKKNVLSSKDLPEGFSPLDFRDPKLWENEDGTYSAVTVARAAEGSGAVLKYDSVDGMEWKFSEIMLSNNHEIGIMWECPDFFTLDGKDVIILSPQEVSATSDETECGNDVYAFIGCYKKGEGFTVESVQVVDSGIDFYATQTVLTPDGRRVMSAWMANWDGIMSCGDDKKWINQLTLPRELHIVDGRLVQNPVEELENYRGAKTAVNTVVEKETTIDGISGRALDMTVELDLAKSDCSKFRIKVASDEKYATYITYDKIEGYIEIDRKRCGFKKGAEHIRKLFIPDVENTLKLRLVLDRFSMEAFVNDGRYAMSTQIATPIEVEGIKFEALGGKADISVVKYDLLF